MAVGVSLIPAIFFKMALAIAFNDVSIKNPLRRVFYWVLSWLFTQGLIHQCLNGMCWNRHFCFLAANVIAIRNRCVTVVHYHGGKFIVRINK